MKMVNIAAFSVLNLILMISCVVGQEIPAASTEKVDASIFESVRSGGDLSDSKEDRQTELINAGTYAFSAQSGIALVDMSSGTTQLVAGNSENVSSAAVPLGFIFRFDGTAYTTFGVSSNGLVRLGVTVSTSSTLNALNSAVNAPKIAPFWDHLCVGATGKVHYRLFGIFGARRLVVEWKNVEINRSGGGCTGTGNSTFQLWISEYNGVVQFVYGSNMVAATTSGGYSLGIQSGAATNFASVTTATNTVDYSNANNTQTSAITQGTSYLFSPTLPATPSGASVTNVRQTSLQLNWADNASNEGGYYVWRTTDTVNFTLVGQLAPNTTSFTDTGLTPATQYRHYVVALGPEGGYSGFLFMDTTTNPTRSMASTPAGGLWSAPSTWVGGVVPDGGDNVTIASGATVIIDTAALAGNVMVGNVGSLAESKDASLEGGAPAVLRFGENAAFSLTVAGNVTIGSNDTFSTGGGSANQHILTVGGNLTNNGTLDFSTNNNQAAASLVFNMASNSTFGGTGPVTDIFIITVNKGAGNILEMTMSNFSVQGSTTDTGASGFLFLDSGTLKISGTFSGSHRTFYGGGAYQIIPGAGIWLNNPNYTIVGQSGSIEVQGLMRVSAGTYNIGTAMADSLSLFPNSSFTIEGGNLNTAGKFQIADLAPSPFVFTYNQTGGTLTTCVVGTISFPNQACFNLGITGAPGTTVVMTGGDIVIHRPASSFDLNPEYIVFDGSDGMANITGTNLHFGGGPGSDVGFFEAVGRMPNVIIEGGQSVKIPVFDGAPSTTTRNINIGTGSVLEFVWLKMVGNTFVNNGIFRTNSGISSFGIDDGTGLTDVTYSGVGTLVGYIKSTSVRCRSLTFDPSVGNIRTINLKLNFTRVINAARITLGNDDTEMTTLELYDGATFESAPDFAIGTGGYRIVYSGVSTTGPEIPPNRTLYDLSYEGSGSVTITGGDLTLTNALRMTNGRVITGPNKLILFNAGITVAFINGYVEGTLTRRVHAVTSYTFPVGLNGRTPLILEVSALNVNPSFLTVTTVDETLPGLLPATSVSRYWKLVTTGDISGRLTFSYTSLDRRGNQILYKLWRSNGGAPVLIPGSVAGNNMMFSPLGMPVVSGDWGIGEQLDPGPVSISGRVTTSGGNPIRNATVILSGGNLQAPVIAVTGSLGTYSFNGLQAGETYTVTASAKRYRFPVGGQQVTPMANVETVDFAANPQEEF